MKHFLIYTNQHKDKDLQVTKRIRSYLEEKQQKVTLFIKDKDWKEQPENSEIEIPSDIDFMLVLGGDGTVLEAARETRSLNIPLIGVNLGTLGYMTQIEISNLEESLDQVISGNYQRESRMMLYGKTLLQDGQEMEGWALNDIVIARSGPLQIVHFNIYVNGQFLNDYQADGVIFTTPTGSTGYNLSAGGPLVEPSAKLIVLTPVCAHTLNQRSIILSPEDVIEIEIPFGREGKVQQLEASFDGVSLVTLQTGDRITIQRAKQTADFIELNKVSFLKILHKKLSN